MIAVHCAHCGARNRIRGRSHTAHPFCGKCSTPLPPHTRWLRIPADLRTRLYTWAPPAALTVLGLLLGIGATGWYLYPSVMPTHESTAAPAMHAAQAPLPIPAARPALPPPVPAQAGVQQRYGDDKPLAPLQLDTPARPLRYYVRIEDARTGRLAMTVLLDGGHSLRTRVPLGSYRVIYAMGATWYGPQALFGPATRRFQLDRVFDFSRAHRRYRGARLQLGQPFPAAPGGAEPVPSIEMDLPRQQDLLTLSMARRR